uniref:glycerol kinase n=1 Tax=Pyramimonas obovata TaxID=1411642 RepID=A0A7S0R1R3_9CHLO|mmetsp:Transcript_23617/g.51542  ORF Transcript_23617/g.51542 Transcript_23617/m.51542 type:complete len:543 (+) Transcript_23617:112-1740(+)
MAHLVSRTISARMQKRARSPGAFGEPLVTESMTVPPTPSPIKRLSRNMKRVSSHPTLDVVASNNALTVGVDVGTQGTKVLVYDYAKREVVGRGSYAYGLMPSDRPNAAEQLPSTWEEGMEAAMAQALEGLDSACVQGIAVSGQQHGLVAIDSNDEVIRPAKLWCDTESAPQAAKLSKLFGWNLVPGFTATKLLWLKENEPENFHKMTKVMLPHDYINYKLTGKWVMECGDASGIGLLDIEKRRFDEERCKSVDESLLSKLPPLVSPDKAIGTLLPEAAARLKLPSGIQVAPGSGDNMMSALGSGAVKSGRLVVSLGTSGTLFGYCAKPVMEPSGTIAPFCDATGGWMPLVCTQNCTTATEEVRECFGLSHADITALAEAEPAGARGVNFLPYLAGARTPNWPHASGTILGLTPGSMRAGVLYRAAIEGATFSLYGGYLAMKELGVEVSELFVVGGGSKNPLWRQIISDIFQVPLRFPTEAESAALGAALQAAAICCDAPVAKYIGENMPPLSDDVVLPNSDIAETYAAAYQRHVNLGKSLFT